jgi:hypothetical protein
MKIHSKQNEAAAQQINKQAASHQTKDFLEKIETFKEQN